MKEKEIHLTPENLAERWNVPLTTLSQWRWNGRGPHYLKLGKRIAYRLQEVEDFEKTKLRRDTTCTGQALESSETIKRENNMSSK